MLVWSVLLVRISALGPAVAMVTVARLRTMACMTMTVTMGMTGTAVAATSPGY